MTVEHAKYMARKFAILWAVSAGGLIFSIVMGGNGFEGAWGALLGWTLAGIDDD
jgi:hypothetical protein